MKSNYVSVVYDENRTPRTNYPNKLAIYLFKRFDFRKEARFLEIGCGRGEFLDVFQKLGFDCQGVDISDYSVNKLSHFKVKKVDITKDSLPYEDNSFDIVFHKSLIEHLYSPEHLMRETYRVLKPGGRVIILTPDWVSQMKVFFEDFTHIHPYDKTSIYDLLKVYGFLDIETELFYQLPILWKHSHLKILCLILQLLFSTPTARKLSNLTSVKFFRWAVELMVFGTGVK